MIDQCDTEVSVCGMFEVVMAASHMMNKKTGSFKSPENLPWLERRESFRHAVPRETLTFSLTDSSVISLSFGID